MSTLRDLKVGSILMMSLCINANANLNPAELDHKSDAIKRALADSSITHIIQPESHKAAMNWISLVKLNIDRGNYNTARSKLFEAGGLLYPMSPNSNVSLSDAKQHAWLIQIDRVISTPLPVAHEITQEQQVGQQNLALAEFLQQNGRHALPSGDLITAGKHFNQAYDTLQQQVVSMRSGDELVIERPDPHSRRRWEDAERRYTDRRFSADWMVEQAETMDADAQFIHTGSNAVDALYRDAQILVQNGNWSEAMLFIDRTYQVMEENGRQAGVDI